MEAWKEQLQESVNSLKRIKSLINLTSEEEKAIS